MSLPRCLCLMILLSLPVLFWAQQGHAPALASAAVPAQSEPSSPPVPQTPVLTSRPAPPPPSTEGRIHLDVVVTGKSGKPASGLDINDFTLLDDKLPRKILSFHAFGGPVQKDDPPVEVILLIDTVNLPFTRVSAVRQQIVAFLLQNGGHLAAPTSIFLMTNDGVSVLRKPSTNGTELAAALNQIDGRLRILGRGAGAEGAIERFEFSIKMLVNIAGNETKMPGRKLLIWAGPGWPMLDGPGFDTSGKDQRRLFDSIVGLSDGLREARIALYSISEGMPGSYTYTYQDFLKGVKTAEKANLPNLGLKVLAVQSGGRVLSPSNDLTAEIDSCVEDAGAFYNLSFDPPRADRPNEYQDLKVIVDKPGLTARTNTGYYNQP